MARFTSIGMSRKKFVPSAAEEAQARQAQSSENGQSQPQVEGGADAGPSTTKGSSGAGGNGALPKGKKRRGRTRTRDETGKRIAIGEKKGPDDGKVAPRWGRDPDIARRSRQSEQHGEDRRQRRFDEKTVNVTCFACRGFGHAAKDCHNILLAASTVGAPVEGEGEKGEKGEKKNMKRKGGKKGGEVTTGKCYRCNSNEHSLHQCTDPIDAANPTPFATCYVCLSQGHLSSLCPSNSKGVYVNGGECKVCQSKAHRAQDCPEDPRKEREAPVQRQRNEVILGTGNGAGADEDDFMVEVRHRPPPQTKNKRHAPAKNGERPMKRVRESDEGYAEQGEVVQQQPESVPLTGRKKTEEKPKAAAKVVAF